MESILLTSELDNAVNESEVNEVPSGALVFKATRTEPVLLQPTQTKYYVATIERERMIYREKGRSREQKREGYIERKNK